MVAIRRTTRAHRVIMFSGHNCGGIPSIGKSFYISSIDWTLSPEHEENFPVDGYQNMPVDAPYKVMLQEMTANGVIHIDTTTVPLSALIGRIYAAEGVKDAYWFFLGCIDNQLSFMSVANYERKFTPDEVTRMELGVNTIRNRFK
jgi:hypothetical protein